MTDIPARVDLDAARPVGPLGLPFRLMGKEVKAGMGVALELTQALGQMKSGNNGAAEPEGEKV